MRKPIKPTATFSEAEKVSVTAACERLIGEFLRPRFLPVIRPTEFNYPVDILGKWRGANYRFIQRYRSGFSDNLGEEFDAPSLAATGLAGIASTSSGIATPENGSACIAASLSLTPSRRSSPTESCTPYRLPAAFGGGLRSFSDRIRK